MKGRAKTDWPSAAIVGLAAGGFLINVYRHHRVQLDDAYITFRFAQHLADGHGLVWNIGGEHTEGYSSLLHVLLLAAATKSGVGPERATIAMGIGAVLTVATLLFLIVRRQCGVVPLLAALALGMYLADDTTAIHATSGLETQLFVMLLCAAYGCALSFAESARWRHAAAMTLAVFLAMICRPEGFLYGAALYGVLALSCVYLPRELARHARPRVAVSVAAIITLTLAYAAWKVAYFGYLLPNPYYVKANQLGLFGAGAVLAFLAHVALWYGPLAGLGAYVVWREERRVAPRTAVTRTKVLLTIAPPLAALAYYCTIIHEVGGAFRFSYPAYFFFVCASAMVLASIARSLRARTWLPAAAIYALALVLYQGSWRWPALPPSGFQQYLFTVGRALRDTGLGPRASVVCSAAGIIPYVSRFNHIDRVGLTDNVLSGRHPITLEERERYVWNRLPDVYVGNEPPAALAAQRAEDDPRMRTPYVTQALLDRQLSSVWSRVAVQDPQLLHDRMRELRDHWEWIGEVNWPGRRLWNLRSFVYVRRASPHADVLRTALRKIVVREPGQIDLDSLR